ncbi:hypothetical protein [Sorangium cellulosum]|uniref:Nucleotidyltransferase family protein n=1 Tax=Sorangium cellulosum So0157-2 TaxID=1254432 RepID=S4Y4G0_SORCE|nr:hypothetical protein [Sorangium cellulosum]AGP39326.1 hypothetical protein SCE1572_35505 [Sorangium cellulosum So0157-2]
MARSGSPAVFDAERAGSARATRAGERAALAPPATDDAAGLLSRAGELEVRVRALESLLCAGVPFMVAGAYAFFAYTGIFRDTKDLDVMLEEREVPAAFRALERIGFETALLDPRWIGKAYAGDRFIDLIFSSSNGLAVVDGGWFEHARPATILGHSCLIAPVEEIIFTKAFVDERERYDGADVNHLIYACGDEMDWERLLDRFGPHWEVLFAHVTLYRFVYPGARSRVPEWLVAELCRRTLEQSRAGDAPLRVCRGNLISRRQYAHDYEELGLVAAPAGPAPEPEVALGSPCRKRRRSGAARRRVGNTGAQAREGAPGGADRLGAEAEAARLRKPGS